MTHKDQRIRRTTTTTAVRIEFVAFDISRVDLEFGERLSFRNDVGHVRIGIAARGTRPPNTFGRTRPIVQGARSRCTYPRRSPFEGADGKRKKNNPANRFRVVPPPPDDYCSAARTVRPFGSRVSSRTINKKKTKRKTSSRRRRRGDDYRACMLKRDCAYVLHVQRYAPAIFTRVFMCIYLRACEISMNGPRLLCHGGIVSGGGVRGGREARR